MDQLSNIKLRTILLCCLALMGVLAGCLQDQPTPATQIPGSTPGPETPVYSLYFTAPDDPTARTLRGGPDKFLAEAIQAAVESVDVAVLELDLWSIRDALLAAHEGGVHVRLVTDSDYIDNPEVQALKKAGIPVLGDRRQGLMHNKFVVIDQQEVWTGSPNLTVNEMYRNNNNLLRIRSGQLADDYTTEFAEMFRDDLFGPDTRAKTPYPDLELPGMALEVFFSPDDGTASHLVKLLESAQDSLNFLAFSFTSDPLAQAVIQRMRAGVHVSGLMEKDQVESNTGGEYDNFRAAGIDVRMDSNPYQMHHKVLIIDERIVVTGSYNFSASAERYNDENTLIIENPDIAAQYLREFEHLFNSANP